MTDELPARPRYERLGESRLLVGDTKAMIAGLSKVPGLGILRSWKGNEEQLRKRGARRSRPRRSTVTT